MKPTPDARGGDGVETGVRILIVDDEPAVRESYRHILEGGPAAAASAGGSALSALRMRLFQRRPPADDIPANDTSVPAAPPAPRTGVRFELTECGQADAALAEVQRALAARRPFAVVFLDMRMPPGRDGLWAAEHIRALDPGVEIVICTAYTDVDPAEVVRRVPPEDKISYLQKPFHPQEVRQLAISLSAKWRGEQRIAQLAFFDRLTGLPNREQARQRLVSAMSAAAGHRGMLALLYLDLDNFKRINDTLGHAAGDQLIGIVAGRVRNALRGVEQLAATPEGRSRQIEPARVGGDEFLVLLPELSDIEDAGTVAQRLIQVVREPIPLGTTSVVITPSIGIAISPRDGQDAETLLRNADLAMYFAKHHSAGSFAFFQGSMNATALARFTIEERLRGALDRHEFSLAFQPVFDVRTGRVSGMEALLRWQSDTLGAVPANEFIPVADETGLILPIGEWVLRAAALQARAWLEQGLSCGRMAVNVSARQFSQTDFPVRVAAILRETGLDPTRLELEITESVVMADESWTARALAQLKQLGISIAIDDFGMGHSSFGRLRNFDVDRLKIDRSFMTSISESSEDRAIAAAIIQMSRALDISVTAEGVESLPQLLFLQEHDCHDAQGYLLSKPLNAADAGRLLQRVSEAPDTSRSQRLRVIIG